MFVGTFATIAWEVMGHPFGLATILVAVPGSFLTLIVVSLLTQKENQMGCRANVRQPIWHHSISPFATSFSFLADSTSFSASSSLNAIGTCVSTPPIPTIAGILSVISSMPYSPCIIADTGRIERSLRTIHSQIRYTDIAIP